MSIDPLWLFLSLIPSGVGLVLFMYGKKQEQWTLAMGGLVLMVYPYFATSIATLIGVGVAIGLAVWCAVRAGW
jgi:hypothetical protein